MMSSPTTLSTIQAMAIERIAWARGFTEGLLDGLSDDQLIARPGATSGGASGGGGNHAIWVMGHLANTDDHILALVTGTARQLDESFAKQFGGGSEPMDDAALYPSRATLLDALRSTRQRTIEWVESLDVDSVHAPTPDALRPFAPDAITIPFTLGAHDLFHAGQVATVRAVLGLSRLHG